MPTQLAMPMPRPAPHAWRGSALAALLSLVACTAPPALPEPPAAATRTASLSLSSADATPPMGHPVGAGAAADAACKPEQRAMIEEAREVARARSAAAARLVATEPGHPHIRRWFGDAPRAEIADRLERTAAQLARPESIKVLCNDPSPCEGASLAFARPGLGIIGLCAGFFRAAMEGLDTRWGILLHEASHLAAETADYAYGATAALILAKDDPRRAARNADNLEYFVETLPR